jgi:hypothetical protein
MLQFTAAVRAENAADGTAVASDACWAEPAF